MKNCEIKRLSDVDIVSVSKLFLVLLFLFVFAVPVFVCEGFAVDGEDVAASAIDRAEAAVVSAYDAVLGAEQVGANVSGLLAQLNVAGEYLASSHVWFGLGDYGNATSFADLCYDVGEEVRGDAVGLRSEASELLVRDLWLKLIFSVVGVVCVVFLSFFVWRAFKRRYRKRVLGMRPEVVSGES